MNQLTKFDLWIIKYFSSMTPANVAVIGSNNPYIQCELVNGNRIRCVPDYWVIKNLWQKVLLQQIWGFTPHVKHLLTEEQYKYFTNK